MIVKNNFNIVSRVMYEVKVIQKYDIQGYLILGFPRYKLLDQLSGFKLTD